MQKIILASGSPRRREILKLLGIEFEVVESFFDENLVKTDDPVEMVEELAMQKAQAVGERFDDAIIIGGDTTVFLPAQAGVNQEILNKAQSQEEAEAMMRKLLGRTHRIITGVAVVNSLTGETFVGHEEGGVSFREATEEEIKGYVQNEKNWRGFAGAYALQGGAAKFRLEQVGKLSAIIGLPIELLVELLEQAGVTVEVDTKLLEESLKNENRGIGI